tara:strand:- start:1302 stop:3296 length:1995 start_codon:yes stop_codon:yes gene_type:complete
MTIAEIKNSFSTNIKNLKDMYKCITKYEIKEQSGFSTTWLRSQLGNTDDNRQMEIQLTKNNELKVNNLQEGYDQFWLGLWRKDTGGNRTGKYNMNIPEPFKITLGSTVSSFQDKNLISWIRVTTTNNGSTPVGKDINDNPLYLQDGNSINTIDSFKKYLKQGGIYWLYLFTGKPTSSTSTSWENKAILSYIVQNKLNLTFPGQKGDNKIKPEKLKIMNMPSDSVNGFLAFYDTDPKYNLGEFYGNHFSIKASYNGYSWVQYTDKAGDNKFKLAGENADGTLAYASSKTKIVNKNLNEDIGLEHFFDEVVNKNQSSKKYVYYIDDGGNKTEARRGIVEEGKNITLNIPMGKWVIESTICSEEEEGNYEPGSKEKIELLDNMKKNLDDLKILTLESYKKDDKQNIFLGVHSNNSSLIDDEMILVNKKQFEFNDGKIAGYIIPGYSDDSTEGPVKYNGSEELTTKRYFPGMPDWIYVSGSGGKFTYKLGGGDATWTQQKGVEEEQTTSYTMSDKTRKKMYVFRDIEAEKIEKAAGRLAQIGRKGDEIEYEKIRRTKAKIKQIKKTKEGWVYKMEYVKNSGPYQNAEGLFSKFDEDGNKIMSSHEIWMAANSDGGTKIVDNVKEIYVAEGDEKVITRRIKTPANKEILTQIEILEELIQLKKRFNRLK